MATINENVSGVTMTAEARVEGDRLVVEYNVSNQTGRAIYVFDQMIRYEGNVPTVDPTTAYCFFEEPQTLRLVRAALRLPLEKEVRVQEIPFAREIPAGGSGTGKIELHIPVAEKSPFYAPPKEDNSKVEECSRVRLLVGWTEFKEGMNIQEVESGGKKVLRIRGAWAAPYQHLLEQRLNLSVKALVHTDTFDRQMPLQ